MGDCLFCKIAKKEVDANIVAESEGAIGFRDVNPVASTHVLVIPKHHLSSAAELNGGDADLLGELFEMMASIATSEGLEDGYRIVTNVGAGAGQSVPHLHFHVIGGRRLGWPPG